MMLPLPVFGSQILFGIYAKLMKKEYKPPKNDSYMPSLAVIIPAWNEAKRIQYALASLDTQSYPVEEVYVIDDGSLDNTYDIVRTMSFVTKNLNIKLYRNKKSIGKTPSVKFAARKAKTDRIMVLDADTILCDQDYIKKIIAPHVDPKTGSTYGTVRPFSRKDQLSILMEMLLLNHHDWAKQILVENKKKLKEVQKQDLSYYLLKWPVERYREALYLTDQYFTKDTSLRVYGTTLFPIGCGVIYNRKLLCDIFDYYESTLGDNLTTSEDIFIGFSIVDRGYANIQVPGAHMISAEPRVDRLPRQLYLWSSSFLQSAYYFKDMATTFLPRKDTKADKAIEDTKNDSIKEDTEQHITQNQTPEPPPEPEEDSTAIKDKKEEEEESKIHEDEIQEHVPDKSKSNTKTEPYEHNKMPFGWIILMPIIEKVSYPLMMIILLFYDYRYAILTFAAEYLLYMIIMRLSDPRMPKIRFIVISLVTLPLRMINLVLDIKITAGFMKDLITGKRDWRK